MNIVNGQGSDWLQWGITTREAMTLHTHAQDWSLWEEETER